MAKKKPRKPIDAWWESYRVACVPLDLSYAQVREVKKAFYAGALALYRVVDDAVDDPDENAAIDALDKARRKATEEVINLMRTGKERTRWEGLTN